MSRNSTRAVLGLLLFGFCLIAAGSPARAGDKEAIVGRWDYVSTDTKYFRFYADGTFKEVAPLNSVEGTYRFLSAEVIELDLPGVFYGRRKLEVKYRLSGDNLDLKFYGFWIKCKRVK
jgi:hypothetical protein